MKGIIATSGACLLLPLPCEAQPPNYDESKVPKYTLPEPLAHGTSLVRSTSAWEKTLRPRTLETFAREMYGSPPAPGQPLSFTFKMAGAVDDAGDGAVVRREYVLTFSHPASPQLRLLLYLPRGVDRAPTFLGLNFRGNHTLEKDPRITLETGYVLGARKEGDNSALAERNRGIAAGRWPVTTITERGYGLATVCCSNIDPDYDDGFQNGIHAMFPDARNRQWGTISSWAWGLSRILDVLGQIREVDSRRVAVIGHSRLGKTALWAGASDERFAMVISNNSGCGGAALSKRSFGETVAMINRACPHWFNDRFKKFNNNEGSLGFDQHQLIALIAPRPVYVASATEDQWADPRGEFLSLLHAEQAYMLYHDIPFGVNALPKAGTSVGNLMGYHLRKGKHDINAEDWGHYLAFADKWLKKREPE